VLLASAALAISLVSQSETPTPTPEPVPTATVTVTPSPEPVPEPGPVEEFTPRPLSLDHGPDVLMFFGTGMLVLIGGVLIGRDL